MDVLIDMIANEHKQVVPITVFVAVLTFCLLIGHLLEENRWVNESITAILIGCISGAVILLISKGKSSHILTFNEELFFIYLLPPIIFNAGFQVKKKQFFHNCLTIMLFGVIGVFISTFLITAGSWWLFPKIGFFGLTAKDYLAIGTIFSSTDTVCTLQVLHQDETPLLYSLVFGEGVVNDATSVVLFNAVQKIDMGQLNGQRSLHVVGDFLYLFSTSTALGFFFGLLTAIILKTLVFWKGKALYIWWAGLMRGAVSIALAFKQFTHSGVTWSSTNAAVLTNTIIVVLFTTLVFGFLTKPLISCLVPLHGTSGNAHQEPKSPKLDIIFPLLSGEGQSDADVLTAKNSLTMLMERPVYTIHFYWRKFDDTYMRPIFGGPHTNSLEC
ncbi:sodium/hydrogen exchanger 4 [Carica papaya]|uniref:sodium/hydrogen exchanger 4 n=1 Tax=Carica papaya TaxID=3649 RepID=UPI000B8CA7FD|nr:sodium/hydrogen exchanger 4 [Carica papaya]